MDTDTEHLIPEEHLINIAQRVFYADGLSLTFLQEGDQYYASLVGKNGQVLQKHYEGPAPSKPLAAFAAEQRYLIEEAIKGDLANHMPGDTYLEKAQNRLNDLLDKEEYSKQLEEKLSLMIKRVNLPEDEKELLNDFLAHGEYGVALESFCGYVEENNIDKKSYIDDIRDLAARMELLNSESIRKFLQ